MDPTRCGKTGGEDCPPSESIFPRAVTTHGFALNVNNRPRLLHHDRALRPHPQTGDLDERGSCRNPINYGMKWRRPRRATFGRVFQSQMLWLESLDDLLAQAEAAPDIEADKVPANQDTPVRLPKELRELHGDGSEIV